MRQILIGFFIIAFLGFFTIASAQETPAEGKGFLGVPTEYWLAILAASLAVVRLMWDDLPAWKTRKKDY